MLALTFSASDPSLSLLPPVEVGGLQVTLRILPFGKLEGLLTRRTAAARVFSVAHKALRETPPTADGLASLEALQSERDAALDTYFMAEREIISWGVWGWEGLVDASGEVIEPKRTRVRFAGLDFDVLSAESTSILLSARLVSKLTEAVIEANAPPELP